MKTFHVHVKVKDLTESIAFYNALFNASPTVEKQDYAKWMLDDPKVNFAISSGHTTSGIEHLGIQTASKEELQDVYGNMQNAKGKIYEEGESTCCYAKSEKSWITDPQGVDWEVFHTHGTATVYGEGRKAEPAPDAMEKWQGNDALTVEEDATQEVSCCEPTCCE